MLVAPFFDLQAVFHKLIILIIQKLGTPTQQQYCIAPKIYTDYLSLVRIRIEAFLSTSIMGRYGFVSYFRRHATNKLLTLRGFLQTLNPNIAFQLEMLFKANPFFYCYLQFSSSYSTLATHMLPYHQSNRKFRKHRSQLLEIG